MPKADNANTMVIRRQLAGVAKLFFCYKETINTLFCC